MNAGQHETKSKSETQVDSIVSSKQEVQVRPRNIFCYLEDDTVRITALPTTLMPNQYHNPRTHYAVSMHQKEPTNNNENNCLNIYIANLCARLHRNLAQFH